MDATRSWKQAAAALFLLFSILFFLICIWQPAEGALFSRRPPKITERFDRPPALSVSSQQKLVCYNLFEETYFPTVVTSDQMEAAIYRAERFSPRAPRADSFFVQFGDIATDLVQMHLPAMYNFWRIKSQDYQKTVSEISSRAEMIRQLNRPLSEQGLALIEETLSIGRQHQVTLGYLKLILDVAKWENHAVQVSLQPYITRLREYDASCRFRSIPVAPTLVDRLHKLEGQMGELKAGAEWIDNQIRGMGDDLRQLNAFIQFMDSLHYSHRH